LFILMQVNLPNLTIIIVPWKIAEMNCISTMDPREEEIPQTRGIIGTEK
jgi:hypothetical protein